MSSSRSRYSGLLITAAFIGPGTVTTATLAGAQFGYQLLWALIFSIFATIIIQDMASRVGIVGQMGLSEALHNPQTCLLYTSPSPRDGLLSRMPSSA